ncbi:MAG: leucine-rich repeat domain-containing protein [Saccharofermentans sp.]|nr:leucine-rich repeat domain-containing protein [Saccharofermentans sp.]
MSVKKVWSAPIALIVVVSALFFGGMTVLADTEPVAGGEFSNALTWTLDSEGTLNISGTGSMGSMSYGGAPWHDYTEQIKTIVIGNGVTDIGEYAFMYCTEATDVTIGNSVQFIDYGAFSYCYKLASVNIPSSVKNIKDGAFRDCSELIDVTLNNGLETIGYSAFINCSSLRNITIPETVTSIASEAFSTCIRLESIEIPSGVEKIGQYTFYKCTSLSVVIFNEGLTEISWGAFEECTALSTVEFPSTLLSIGANAFSETAITNVELPKGFQGCGEKAFYDCDKITELILDFDNASFGVGAFENCDSLESVKLKGNITAISYNMFRSCKNLKSIEICGSVTAIFGFAFYNCESLESITIPDGVKEIKENTFNGCKKLATVILPENLKIIGVDAFHYTAIESVDIPDLVTLIDTSAFAECPNLSFVTLPDSLEIIGQGAFSDCPSLQSIVIPEGVTAIGDYAFQESGLVSANIPSSVEFVGKQVFKECEKLESVTISEGLTYLPEEGFYSCSSLKTFDIPESVEFIEKNAFCDSGLESITIPGNVKVINESAFDFCKSLVYVDMLSGVEVIHEYAFYSCSSLQSIVIPASVTQIEDDAFFRCDVLKDIYFYGNSNINWFDSDSDDFIEKPKNSTLFHVNSSYESRFNQDHSDLNVTFVGDLDATGSRVTGHSISLSDEIAVNFYIYLPEGYDISNVTVDFTWGKGIDANSGESYVHNVKGELVPVNRYGANYVVKCGVAARAMNDNIVMIVKCGEQTLISDSYSVAKYMNYLSSNYNNDHNLMTLVLAMAHYAYASETYFKYGNADWVDPIVLRIPNSEKSVYYRFSNTLGFKAVSVDPDTLNLLNIEEDDLGISFYGASSLSTTQTKMRFYFRITDASKAALLEASFNGTDLKFKKRTIDGEKLLYIETPGLTYNDIEQDMEFTINGRIYKYNFLWYYNKLVQANQSNADNIYYIVAEAQYSFAHFSKIYQEGLLNND